MTGPTAPQLFQESIKRAVALLWSFVQEQFEEEQEAELKLQQAKVCLPRKAESKKVFIVHGHRSELKMELARLLEKLQLEPVILHEAPDQAQTIIEKLEKNSEVGFAVVVLTGDDEGRNRSAAGEFRPRARQNVLFEYGYFVGLLGRKKVMALQEADVEDFSDYNGVLVTQLDKAGAWKTKLARELKEAGYNVDMNRLL